jgi:hypothetical protein
MMYLSMGIGSTVGLDPAAPPWPWTAVIVSLLAGAVALALALKFGPRPAPRRPTTTTSHASIQDILARELRRSNVAETAGVRWEIALYPKTLSVPGYVVFTALLQNATDRPRAVTLEIAPGALLPRGFTCSCALKGGEAGILRAPLFVSKTTEIGDHRLSARLAARAPEGEGKRLLPEPQQRDSGPRTASLQVVSSHSRPPVNLFAFEWKGFTSLYIPPQTAPDLTELRILQELPSYPEED